MFLSCLTLWSFGDFGENNTAGPGETHSLTPLPVTGTVLYCTCDKLLTRVRQAQRWKPNGRDSTG